MKKIWIMYGLFFAVTASQSVFAEKIYPPAVKKAVLSFAADCKAADAGKFTESAGFIREADLTGDGINDYILDTAKISCGDGYASFFTGNSGGSIQIFAGTKGGDAKKVFDEYKEEVFLKKNKLSLGVRYAECGANAPQLTGAADAGCLRQVDWNPVKQEMEFGKVLKMN